MDEPRPVPALVYGSVIRLKRAKTSLSDVETVDSDLRTRGPTLSIGALPRQDVAARKRPRRGFSLNKLTTSLGLQKPTRQRIDKASISRPIVDCQSVVPVSPSSLQLGHISPTSHTSHFLHATTSPTGRLSQRIPPFTEQPPATNLCRSFNNTAQKLGKMDPSRLSLQPPATGTKLRARQQAQEMQNLVIERARRSGEDPPPYEFFELIGRGSFGRVFKGADRKTGDTVAIKILDIDSSDYIERSQDQLSTTLKEISILQQLRDSKARPYVNVIMEALPVHNELWIISEYASGGSVSTLMKPTINQGLEEKFIIPIARELAWALKYTHEIGILHRDLKCANILILEDGRVQLCDFGVSGIVEARQAEPSKRFSVHGTPHWLAPELIPPLINNEFETELPYGAEVDIWAYACTVYEMATGKPPNATTAAINLPNAPLPTLEGDRYSEDLKDFVDFLFVRDPENRPTTDQILEHPYLVNSTKMYPTVMLVKLLEDYTQWERGGGARASLFDPRAGAMAPDPLAPEDDDDDDWTFSTSEEFETRLSRAFPEQFGIPNQNQDGEANDSVHGQDRFANLMEIWKQERIARGKEGLERLFNPNADPYQWDNNGRPPSDLVLRDYHPGAPNRETVIDLDFAAPVASDGPSIDLGDVPHVRASRRYLRDSQLEMDDSDTFDMDAMMKRATQEWKFPSSEDQDLTVKRSTQDWKFPLNEEIARRATKDWKFPMTEESLKRATRDMKLPVNEEALKRATKDWKFPMSEEALKRATQDWKFPPMPEQPNRQTKDFQFPPPAKNRGTREWTFSAAIAEANYNQRNSRRETRDWKFPTAVPAEQPINRKTRDFVFPMSETVEDEADQGRQIQSSPTLESNFRPSLRHAATEPASSFDDYPRVDSTPNSPLRSSMIDLDMAMVDDYRPPSAGSASTTIRTALSEQLHDNPFNLEDQVHLSENNNRASYHTKSQSEPNHAIPGLLTPQTFDEQGQPTNVDSHHQNMHARGVSSVSQMQAQLKPPTTNNAITQHRPYQRSQAQIWDGWSHSAAYNTGSDESPPASVVTDISVDDEDIDEAWDALEKQTIFRNRYQIPGTHHQTTASRDDDVHYPDADNGDYEDPARHIRVSLGPNGKPLVEFPIPRGPDPEALLGINGIGDGSAKLQDALWKSAAEIRDGVRACRDLMKAMRLVEGADEDESNNLNNGNSTDISATVRLSRVDR
ncbi:hypothetical protein DM02DRAFT_156040 [Periconia macrospinosa]|uniref:non-specific serine/threonine protein kinase n=1 Tax=Periconia macrospinosa TaxID=97972 RepID=A0A2V1ECF7_9PLEO|nr:hypothetical protein DM02DRAFT_156040 [Periconia macrospinosa]